MTPSPSTFLARVVDPGLAWVATHAGVQQNRAQARTFLLAVAIQETDLTERAQRIGSGGVGPARGWWQFEMPTIGLMLGHKAASPRLSSLCEAAWVRCAAPDIWRCLEGHDFLALGVARLLLLTDPQPVPLTAAEGWDCYARRLWRPGKPHPAKWGHAWEAATQACSAAIVL
jgi:hypothetical protein